MHSNSRLVHQPARARHGFTLIELLVVLGIIALIVSVVLVAMGGVRSSVRRTESANALRQMVAAYDAYSTEYDKRLMPGFVTAAQASATGFNILAKRENGDLHTDVDSRGYVWRLAPYLGFKWSTMFVDYGNERLNGVLQTEYDSGAYGSDTLTAANQIGIADVPSFGLNSIFLGGDSVHGDTATDYSPWNTMGNETIAATRFSEVKNPSNMIVFAPVMQGNPAMLPSTSFSEVRFGFAEARAPFLELNAGTGLWGDQQWQLDNDGTLAIVTDNAAFMSGGGLPVARWGGGAFPVGNLDGSTTVETLVSLSNDMRRWSHKATGLYTD